MEEFNDYTWLTLMIKSSVDECVGTRGELASAVEGVTDTSVGGMSVRVWVT